MPFDPGGDDVLRHGARLLVGDEDRRLKPREGVHKVQNVRRSIFVSFIFF